MLERFLDIKSAVSKALTDIKEQQILANVEFETLHEIVAGLKPVKIDLEKRRNATLLTAEGEFAFIIGELDQQNSEFVKNMNVLWSKDLMRNAMLVYLDQCNIYILEEGLMLLQLLLIFHVY
ncbi:hypothetical protein AVEN_218798-1 [Araneus ventricosus]|uniref:Uncharacterized protein n=1 Tax=Araneus ventricosus TaxID=182803 RepID=A0A4Y2B426_ARAVE|nr:hypothetical protein AVEN_218798-1 [Araneus ventricosus]